METYPHHYSRQQKSGAAAAMDPTIRFILEQKMETQLGDHIEGRCTGLERCVAEMEQRTEECLVSLEMARSKSKQGRAHLEKQFDGLKLKVHHMNRLLECETLANRNRLLCSRPPSAVVVARGPAGGLGPRGGGGSRLQRISTQRISMTIRASSPVPSRRSRLLPQTRLPSALMGTASIHNNRTMRLGRLTPKLMSQSMVCYLPDLILVVPSCILSLADLLRIVLKWGVRVKGVFRSHSFQFSLGMIRNFGGLVVRIILICTEWNHLWIHVASMHFEGIAARWTQSMERRVRSTTWEDFCLLLHDRFGRDQHEALIRQLFHIR
jgi:hypothetical protein